MNVTIVVRPWIPQDTDIEITSAPYSELSYITVKAWMDSARKIGVLMYDDPMKYKLGFLDGENVWHTLSVNIVRTPKNLSKAECLSLQNSETRKTLLSCGF